MFHNIDTGKEDTTEADMQLTFGSLMQTAEAFPLLRLFGLEPGEEIPIHVNFVRVENFETQLGVLLSLPEFPSMLIH